MDPSSESIEKEKEFCSETNIFLVNAVNAISLKEFGLRSSVVGRFRNVNNCLEMVK
jgi:hypothetical protein